MAVLVNLNSALAAMITVVAGLGAAILLLIWWTSPTYVAGEPQPVKHTIPFLGHGYNFATNKRALYIWGLKLANNNPYSLLIAGKKHYVFYEAQDVNIIHRSPKSLSINAFVEMLQHSLFGMTKVQAAKHRSTMDVIHKELTQFILSPEQYDITFAKYSADLEKSFAAFDKQLDGKDSIIVDALQLVVDLQAIPTTTAYFGEEIVKANPQVIDDLIIWLRDCFWKCLVGMPKWTMKKGMAARERLLDAIQSVLDKESEDRSNYLKSHAKLRLDNGWDPAALKNDLLSFLFAIQGNSIPTAYATILRIVQDKEYLSTVLEELSAAGYYEATPKDMVSIIPSKVPHMVSLWWETLRYSQTAMTVREVIAPITIRGYDLQPGAICTVPGALVHRDPAIHAEADTFKIKRFLAKELGGMGQSPLVGVRAFGGGSSYCPGRIFAQKQVISTVAGLVSRYDVEVVEGAGRFPEELDFEHVMSLDSVKLKLTRKKNVA